MEGTREVFSDLSGFSLEDFEDVLDLLGFVEEEVDAGVHNKGWTFRQPLRLSLGSK